MKEITRIHLAKTPYEIEIGAKKKLSTYLDELKKYSEDDTVFDDIEIRITEILEEQGVNSGGIITSDNVKKIREQLGEPEVFSGKDSESKEPETPKKKNSFYTINTEKRIYRDQADGKIAGVAAGISNYLSIDVAIVRIIFIILIFVTFGWMIPIYILMALSFPKIKNANDVLRMRGEPVSIAKIKEINEEYDFDYLESKGKTLWRVITIIFGTFSSLVAIFGVVMICIADYAIYTLPTVKDGFSIIAQILFNISGVMFVIFFTTLASIFFMMNIKKVHYIIMVSVAIMGICTFMPAITMVSSAKNNIAVNIEKTAKTKELNIDKDALSKVKNLKSIGETSVNYIVSDKYKVEYRAFELSPNVPALAPEIHIDGDNLFLDYPTRNFEFNGITSRRVTIYGPALNKITTQNDVNYTPASDQDSLEIIERGSGNVSIKNSVNIRNLKVDQNGSNFSTVKADYVNVDKLNYTSDGGLLELKSVNDAVVHTDGCEDPSGANVNLNLETKVKKLELNDQNVNNISSQYHNKCFNMETKK